MSIYIHLYWVKMPLALSDRSVELPALFNIYHEIVNQRTPYKSGKLVLVRQLIAPASVYVWGGKSATLCNKWLIYRIK